MCGNEWNHYKEKGLRCLFLYDILYIRNKNTKINEVTYVRKQTREFLTGLCSRLYCI